MIHIQRSLEEIMAKQIKIRLSPGIYINEPGILKTLPNILEENKFSQSVILLDDIVEGIIVPYLPENFLQNYSVLYFSGNCTQQEINRLSDLVRDGEYETLIAFGGGQLMDTAKVVADSLSLNLINVPTLPSNCAAIATQSILYSEKNHSMSGVYRMHKTVDVVLIEPEIHLHSPKKYILSGIGDTLAKFYEIRHRLNDENIDLIHAKIGRNLIDICRRDILSIRDLENLSEIELRNFLDTVFLVASLVDGFLASEGGAVLAHAFYNAYTAVKENYQLTHGELVAFGILLQLELEEDSIEFQNELKEYYTIVGLPQFLEDVELSSEDIEIIANKLSDRSLEKVSSVFPNITSSQLVRIFENRG